MNLREKKNSCVGWIQGGELFMSWDCGVAVYPEIVPRVSAVPFSVLYSPYTYCRSDPSTVYDQGRPPWSFHPLYLLYARLTINTGARHQNALTLPVLWLAPIFLWISFSEYLARSFPTVSSWKANGTLNLGSALKSKSCLLFHEQYSSTANQDFPQSLESLL
jgi:hypothetical protein